MEIKTCEQYVVERLREVEEEKEALSSKIDNLNKTIATQNHRIEELRSVLVDLCADVEVKTDIIGGKRENCVYIPSKFVWEDEDDFYALYSFLSSQFGADVTPKGDR